MIYEMQHWSHFNPCSIALALDMEALIAILGGEDLNEDPDYTE